jgi:hypothetical protein
MSLDILNGKIRVLNYEQSPVGFPSQHNQQGAFIRGRDENEDFVIERVAFDDIEIENSKSDLFKVGRLRFHPDEEEEIYLKLGIEDKENILSDKQLFDLLMNDSIDVIKRISSLKSLSLLSRMKSKLFTMERTGKMPPHTITAVVSERLSELKNGGKRNPDSEINRIMELDKKAQQEGKLQEKLELLMQKVETLEQESKQKDDIISKSHSALEELLAKVASLSEPKLVTSDTEDNKKPVGRPPKDK